MNLLLVCGTFSVPEAFDITNLFDAFKSQITESDMSMVENFINYDIPIVIDSDNADLNLTGKLKQQCLVDSYEKLEECFEQDVYFLCKMERIDRKDSVKIFDPLKDFIKIPRSMRRSGRFDVNKFQEIGGPVARVEVIAIYK